MFKPLNPKKTIPQVEEEVLDFWRNKEIFPKSLKAREGSESFVFYEGPPTANGRPGIHHVMARTFKDVICRYQVMRGKYVLRKAGWDTHGLPVELQVEKELGLKNKADIERYGIAEFNKKCKESVWQYKEEWEKLTERMGFWLDLEHPYITYENDYIESVWWAIKQIWDKGYIYQDYKVVPYCPRCGTPLSLAEVAQGYQDVTETSVIAKFALVDEPDSYLLAWTTTPWTLPGNVALAVGNDITYVAAKQDDTTYYLAKDRLNTLHGDYEVIRELPVHELVGKRYKPLFDFLDLGKESGKEAYRVVAADFVTTEDGTGIVHTAVMYGEEDFALGKKADLPFVHTVNERGEFNELVKPWAGHFVKDVEKEIVTYLKEYNLLYKTGETTHTYPFCWRCSTPLLYYARNSWFIRIDDDLRARLVKLNQEITWVPEYVKKGRFGNWLEGLRDWAISRERYWGTPLPIWVCETDPSHKVCVESTEELRSKVPESQISNLKSQNLDLHKPYIDEVTIRCEECNGTMRRVPEVLDVWFDSGSMPFAQWHYPYENEETFSQQFPADYISEGIDQTRGWFNSLHIIGVLLFDNVAFKSVITPNLVLDEKGQKMSKSKGNVVDPWEVIAETGIDAARLYFLSVNQPGDPKNFSLKAVRGVYRKVITIWWNVVSFFLTYASVDNWQPGQEGQRTLLDEWIISLAGKTTKTITESLDQLDTFTASRAFAEYIDDLSTWYLRRSRKRRDLAFYSILHQVLVQTSVIAAPFTPFIAESTYQALRSPTMPESVHLMDFTLNGEIDIELLDTMNVTRSLVTLGHAARSEAGIKLRQPLQTATIINKGQVPESHREILKEELNVEEIIESETVPEGWPTSRDGSYTVAINPEITPELREKGTVRELIRVMQELRKKADCQPGQSVSIYYQTDYDELKTILEKHTDELRKEVAASVLEEKKGGSGFELTAEVNGKPLHLGLIHEQ